MLQLLMAPHIFFQLPEPCISYLGTSNLQQLDCLLGLEKEEITTDKSNWLLGLQSTIKPGQVYLITSLVSSIVPDTVLTLLETGIEGEQ